MIPVSSQWGKNEHLPRSLGSGNSYHYNYKVTIIYPDHWEWYSYHYNILKPYNHHLRCGQVIDIQPRPLCRRLCLRRTQTSGAGGRKNNNILVARPPKNVDGVYGFVWTWGTYTNSTLNGYFNREKNHAPRI
jgi:hypothetical protein